jgi:hypothetical protein
VTSDSDCLDLVGKARDGPRIRFDEKLERVKFFEGDDVVQEKTTEIIMSTTEEEEEVEMSVKLKGKKNKKEDEEEDEKKKEDEDEDEEDDSSEQEREERAKFIRRWGDSRAQDSARKSKVNHKTLLTKTEVMELSAEKVLSEEDEEEDWVDHLQELVQVTKTIRSLERLIIRYRTKIVQETPNAKDEEDMKILNDWKIRIEVSQKQLEKLCVFFSSSISPLFRGFFAYFFLLLSSSSSSSSSIFFFFLLIFCFFCCDVI